MIRAHNDIDRRHMLKVIINADDFGLSSAENRVILHAFEQGVISSATLMANMPAFTEACELAQQHNLQDRIGLHFNITYGEPLSQLIRQQPQLCSVQGQFNFTLARYTPWLKPVLRDAIRQELETQWQRCVKHGIRPSHIDSHQHVHNLWPIAALVAEFAHEQQVPVRQARNLGRNINPIKAGYKYLLNRRLARISGCTVRYTCTPQDLFDGLGDEGPLEVICHPYFRADGSLGDEYLIADVSLSAVLDMTITNYSRVSFSTLHNMKAQ